jgi:hypothetical protein
LIKGLDGTVRNFHYLAATLICFSILGCEAPRYNPYDPDGDAFIGYDELLGTLSGRVTMRSGDPLEGVLILAIPDDVPDYRGASTDEDGEYLIEEIIDGGYRLACAPEGFVPDTHNIVVINLQEVTENFQLNALPIIHVFDITTHLIYEGSFPQPYHYELWAAAFVEEPDGSGDIDSVVLKTTEEDIYFELEVNPPLSQGDSIYYGINIHENALPSGSLIQGTEKWNHYFCDVRDNLGASTVTEPTTLTRIFDKYPDPVSPKPPNNQVSADTIVFTWLTFPEQFYFTYSLEIRRASTQNLEWDTTRIAPIEDSLSIYNFLDNDEFYWRLTVVDEFGNTSQSDKAYFEVNK